MPLLTNCISKMAGNVTFGKSADIMRNYVFLLLFMVGLITSLGPYYLWNYNLTSFQLLSFLCFGLWSPRILYNKGMIVPFLLLFLFYFYSAINQMPETILFRYFYTFIPFFLFFVKADSWKKIYHFFYVCYSISLIPSIILFVLVMYVGLDFPSTTIEPVNAVKLYDYQAYPCLVIANNDQFMRFCGYYDEAGVVGTISGVVLLINKLNLKDWKNWPVLIGGLLSFSLFFYALLALYVLLFSNLKIKIVVFALIALAVIYISFDDSYFSKLIIERLEFDDGSFAGDNRTTGNFSRYYTRFLGSDNVWSGLGTKYCETVVDVGGCSYKHIVVNQGVIFVAFYVVAMESFYYLKFGFSKNFILLSLVFLSLFYQRPFLYTTLYIMLFLAPAYVLPNQKINEKCQIV